MKTLTVGEIRNILSYMPDEAECFIALSKDRIVAIDVEPAPPKTAYYCDCEDGEECTHCREDPEEQIFFRTM